MTNEGVKSLRHEDLLIKGTLLESAACLQPCDPDLCLLIYFRTRWEEPELPPLVLAAWTLSPASRFSPLSTEKAGKAAGLAPGSPLETGKALLSAMVPSVPRKCGRTRPPAASRVRSPHHQLPRHVFTPHGAAVGDGG